ncbi:MAG: cupin domain-containing protein [Alphaproteobacteria bacterium]|nr:cupin domain-containing protein [Alphaproteobacteria bacterium]
MSTENETPPHPPISLENVAWEAWQDVPRFAVRYRHLTSAVLGDDYHVGVAVEELQPGMQSAPAHYHFFEEEHVYVLEGTLTVRLGASRHAMKAGAYACFPAGQKAGHCLINDSGTVCRYVIIGERSPNEVVVYPDSNKVLVRPLGRRALYDMAAVRGYWDGEDTGAATPEDVPREISPPPVTEAQPKLPVAFDDIAWELWHEGSRFGGRVRHLTKAAVGRSYHVGVLVEELGPGMQSAPAHYHLLEEEQALILSGQGTLRLGDKTYALKPWDYVCFPAGQKAGHCFVNTGTEPLRYLMVGERNLADVCVYPDSNKMAVSALRTRDDIFDMSARRQYWDGEKTT